MSKQAVIEKVSELVSRALAEKGLPAPALSADSELLGAGLGIDSLDLAAIVVELSDATGRDPFQDGFIEFRTVGELSDLYAAD